MRDRRPPTAAWLLLHNTFPVFNREVISGQRILADAANPVQVRPLARLICPDRVESARLRLSRSTYTGSGYEV